ncbi:kinesin light chain 1 [Ophiobolus disseminans]|uniref:Kinesin light chain 1 n=1 Tax=Ophiobolus disseminans TaxID=1469910 RepID=A0A6A6ZBB7_9PLEO|nr:kinesin light chain 1 [Ophiobolus disseminans]
MRLLKCRPGDDGFELTTLDDNHALPYAILSHTWTADQEVTYKELLKGTGILKSGYAKLRFCGERAAADGLEYFWVDTCCIDKTTSDELSTAINSMFRWYQRAARCYVYLTDVSVPEEVTDAEAFRISREQAFRRSRWFTRGWTLQELLAPASVEFFSREGKLLGNRISLEQEIHEITGIPAEALRGRKLSEFSVEERMRWAAGRTTTLKEDRVYCLLGIFGVFLSLIYGEGEDYATLRLKEEIQKRQQGQTTDLQDLPPPFSLPFPRNELFVGRQSQLKSIEQTLLVPNSHRRMTIYGLGGCGKSALVLEFAYRALAECAGDLVFWVPAISRESFELAYREIATHLRLPRIADPNTNINKLVKEALSADSFGRWLMIVDNADDPAVLSGLVDGHLKLARLDDYLPHSRRGAVLFTTRSRKVARTLTPGCVLELKDMSQGEAKELLTQHITEEALLNDLIAIDQLLSILAYLPLAIVQAAAFINNNETSISEYVSLFKHPGAEIELFSEQFEDPSRYREMDSTIAKTWHISFDQLRRQDPLAAEYLSFMACIDRTNIPQSLLPLKGSAVQRVKALGTLTGYAFITERQQTMQGVDGERFFNMHRLVHVASTAWLHKHEEWASWTNIVVNRLEELVPWGGHEGKEVWAPYLSHAVHTAGHEDTVKGIAMASLLYRVGRCQTSLGQYAAAEVSYRQALSLRKEVLGHEHPDTLMSMNNLAAVLDSQGKYEEAEKMHRQTLARYEKVLGHEHPSTLTSMNNLAQEAETMHRQTLARYEKVLGHEHPSTLISMNNLALVLDRQGKYEEAETMHRQTLARKEKVLGHEHPDTLTSVYCLAHLLAHRYRYGESLVLYDRASTGYEAVIGKDHPTTRACRQHHADALASQEQDQPVVSPTTANSGASTRTSIRVEAAARTSKDGH